MPSKYGDIPESKLPLLIGFWLLVMRVLSDANALKFALMISLVVSLLGSASRPVESALHEARYLAKPCLMAQE